VKDGSTTIAVDLPLAIQTTFSGLRPPDAPWPSRRGHNAMAARLSSLPCTFPN